MYSPPPEGGGLLAITNKSDNKEVVYEVVVNEQFDIRENRTVCGDEDTKDFIIVDENDVELCKLEDLNGAELYNICMTIS